MPKIKRNRNANNNINRAYQAGVIANLVKRLPTNYVITLNDIKRYGRYAIVNNKNFLGFASVSNNGNVRSLELIAARKGYGNALMKQIINNARKNQKRKLTLTAVGPKLVNWYKRYQFVPAHTVGIYTNMSLLLRNRGLRGMVNSN